MRIKKRCQTEAYLGGDHEPTDVSLAGCTVKVEVWIYVGRRKISERALRGGGGSRKGLIDEVLTIDNDTKLAQLVSLAR